jgi:hypothetical protein
MRIEPGLEFVYEAGGALGDPVPIGETAEGTRRMIPIFVCAGARFKNGIKL